jgi:putative DNA primase/helicase
VLHSEIPGLVNWLLGLTRDQVTRAIMNPPTRLQETNQEALRYGNPIADWLLESVIPERGHKAKVGDKRPVNREGRTTFDYADEWLYPNYLTWCQRAGRESVSLTRFSALVMDIARSQKLDVLKARSENGVYLQGIRLRQKRETAYSWQPAPDMEVF